MVDCANCQSGDPLGKRRKVGWHPTLNVGGWNGGALGGLWSSKRYRVNLVELVRRTPHGALPHSREHQPHTPKACSSNNDRGAGHCRVGGGGILAEQGSDSGRSSIPPAAGSSTSESDCSARQKRAGHNGPKGCHSSGLPRPTLGARALFQSRLAQGGQGLRR